MKPTGIRILVGTLALVAFPGVIAAGQDSKPPAPPFGEFIIRQGDKLMDGDREFRFVGANMPGMTLPYDYTLDIESRMVLPVSWELEDGFQTLQQMNAGVVRWHIALPVRLSKPTTEPPYEPVLGPGQVNEAAFQNLDYGLALASRYGIRVIFGLAGAGTGTAAFAGAGSYAAHRGKSQEEFYTDPQLKEDFKATIRSVLNLVMSGHALKPLPAEVNANIDIYTQHYYGEPSQWAWRCAGKDCSAYSLEEYLTLKRVSILMKS